MISRARGDGSHEDEWLAKTVAAFAYAILRERDPQALTDRIMSELTPLVGAQQGACYLIDRESSPPVLALTSTYAYSTRKQLANRFGLGEGLVGQCARERKPIIVTEVPQDYVHIVSGLGHASALNLAVYPVLFEDKVRGVIELGSFHAFTPIQLALLDQAMPWIGLALDLIGSSARNIELDRRREELEELEARTQDLARASQFKSQFLANMSHEIRTPLNSVMILAQMLAANEEHTLTPKQVEWAATIHAAGRDLLALINQILDLSKVEAGRIEAHAEPYAIAEVGQFVERTFRPMALQRELGFAVETLHGTPASVTTDHQLLQQILKNLLANAFKFTERGQVKLRIARASATTPFRSPTLRRAAAVIAFAVSDTGIGIPAEHQQRIFEAFQQGDASITRKYGGTGLGLAISREYARVLGGEITVDSTAGAGSTFTLYMPVTADDLQRAEPTPVPIPSPPPTPLPTLRRSEASSDAPTTTPSVPIEHARAIAGHNILVVEDDARNLFAITTMLERLKANVVPASNAQEAYARLRTRRDIDVILMDIMMPDVDGLQATREIRKMPDLAPIPIIALTAKASPSDRDRCIEAGCTDYMSKPVDVRQLAALIARYLKAR